ncbi:MAG: FAD-binding oxidoreductase [Acidimicrobiia bacterium]|nr:FAD-binding oxidoreductase [Acidimicrobiia bacterium]MDH3469988.1 FAD-binding oxidoreductase [Acidimicrobiia bacterium]
MESFDFAVIGGGIAGASAAYELAAHGSVVLLETEDTCGYHTTGRSAAIFTEAYEHDAVRLLTLASRSFLQEPPDGFAEVPILSPMAVLVIGRDDQKERVAEEIAAARTLVPSVEQLDGPQAENECPVLREGYVAAAMWEPDSRAIDVDALHQGFLRGVRERGGLIKTSSPVSGLVASNGSWTVTAGDQKLNVSAVVNAAGAWASEVGAMAGASSIDLVPHRRTAFTFAAPVELDTTALPMVVDVDEDFYFKPEGPQFLASLAEETPMPPHDVRHEEVDVALAIERIEAATTLQIRHVGTAWAGLRTFAVDRLPVVGEDPAASGFFWLAGQGGFGIMTSPAMARAIAGLVVERSLPPDLLELGVTAKALSPQRLLG